MSEVKKLESNVWTKGHDANAPERDKHPVNFVSGKVGISASVSFRIVAPWTQLKQRIARWLQNG